MSCLTNQVFPEHYCQNILSCTKDDHWHSAGHPQWLFRVPNGDGLTLM